jgi:hypothetical protein
MAPARGVSGLLPGRGNAMQFGVLGPLQVIAGESDQPDTVSAARIVTRAPGYAIEVSSDELDASWFEALTHQAGAAVRAGRWAQAARAAAQAQGLWRGTRALCRRSPARFRGRRAQAPGPRPRRPRARLPRQRRLPSGPASLAGSPRPLHRHRRSRSQRDPRPPRPRW